MKIYMMKETLTSYDGSVSIEKGKLVMFKTNDRLVTLNGKTAIVKGKHKQIPQYICGCSYGWTEEDLKNYIKPCKITCKDSELLMMHFRSDYHDYYTIGTNPYEMYKKIVKMWNSFSGTKYTIANFHKQEYFDGYHALVYKIDSSLCYFHDECSPRLDDDKELDPIGDWMSVYRDSLWTPWGRRKDFFNKSMI